MNFEPGPTIVDPTDEMAVTNLAFNLCVLYYTSMNAHFKKMNHVLTKDQKNQKEVSGFT